MLCSCSFDNNNMAKHALSKVKLYSQIKDRERGQIKRRDNDIGLPSSPLIRGERWEKVMVHTFTSSFGFFSKRFSCFYLQNKKPWLCKKFKETKTKTKKRMGNFVVKVVHRPFRGTSFWLLRFDFDGKKEKWRLGVILWGVS